jgi:hypothetical protein
VASTSGAASGNGVAGAGRPDLIERETQFAPGSQTAGQRPDALNALLPQEQRHTGAGSFAGSSAIEDDIAVPRNRVLVFLELFRNQVQGPANHVGVGFEIEGVAQVNNRNFMALVQHPL